MDTNQTFVITSKFYLSLLEFLLSGKQHIVAIGAEFGLTNIQAITLMLIDADKPRPMGVFGQLFHCDASNVTGIIDGLEQKQLVERMNDPKDRRIKIVCLLPDGLKLQEQILERLSNDRDFPFGPLDPIECKQFAHIVQKLATHNRIQ